MKSSYILIPISTYSIYSVQCVNWIYYWFISHHNLDWIDAFFQNLAMNGTSTFYFTSPINCLRTRWHMARNNFMNIIQRLTQAGLFVNFWCHPNLRWDFIRCVSIHSRFNQFGTLVMDECCSLYLYHDFHRSDLEV